MVEPHVTLDTESLSPVEEKLRGPLEEQLTSAMQAASDKITHEYAGEPVDAVTVKLLEQTRAGLHPDIAEGFAPDQAELRRVAEAIVRTP
jgi:K+-transporting ATPase c subunit